MSHGAYKEAHPIGMRITHWVHLISMVVLAVTGFYIHNPFFDGVMGWMRTLHFIFMYVVLVALIARIYFAFFGRSATLRGSRAVETDIKNFLPQAENKGKFIEMLKYYLFLRKTHPVTGKYNSLQKLTYSFLGALLLVQAFTGFAMYGPYVDRFMWLTTPLGGLMVVRQIHYLVMWVFILITMIHVYLSAAEDVEALPLMFWGKETPAGD